MAEERNYGQDVDGFDEVTSALMALVNSYPGLDRGIEEHFDFTVGEPEDGLSVMATSGSVIYDSRESITGHVRQLCLYPFTVIYRASGLSQRQKISVKEWMDRFAKWLTKQPVNINGVSEKLAAWPTLTEGRVIRSIERSTPCYLAAINEDKSEVWVMDLSLRYRNEFQR